MFPIDSNQILTAGVIFLRITAIVSLLPLFGDSNVPVRVRILLSAALSVAIYPLVPANYGDAVMTALSGPFLTAIFIAKEALIGIVIGYTAKLAFDGIVMAANIVSVQMGFNTSNIFLPGSEETTNGFSATHRLLIVLIFLSLNMHYMYISSIADSFRLIPAGFAWPSNTLSGIMVHLSATIFVTALQLAAPTLVGLLFATAALGLISRTVPQANVFVLSFPISFFTGLLVYMATLPMLPGWLQSHFTSSQNDLISSLAALVK
ncbi:MAG: flagellar biosynthetic protein FliR [Proteobacteria bacterium]|nr:flagellar biosynthetic protein FliR [Pseudomonadota bacterium]